jgi:hypothetical protein
MPRETFYPAVVEGRHRSLRSDQSETITLGLDDSQWELIEECWAHEPGYRPSVAEVESKLNCLRGPRSRFSLDDGSPTRSDSVPSDVDL